MREKIASIFTFPSLSVAIFRGPRVSSGDTRRRISRGFSMPINSRDGGYATYDVLQTRHSRRIYTAFVRSRRTIVITL